MDFLSTNRPFFVSAATILLGYVLKKVGVLKETDGETLAKVALNVTLPAIILLNVPAVSLSGGNAALPFIAPTTALLTVLIGLVFFRRQSRTDRGLSLAALSGYNIGLFAMPMVAGIYGAAGVGLFALVDLGNAFAVFILAYYMAYRYSPLRKDNEGVGRTIARMFFKSIPFMSYIIAIVMNLLGWSFRGFIADFLAVPAAMNRGVALMTLGVLLRFRFSRETWKAILPTLGLRYCFGITVGALALYLLPIPLESRIAVAGVLVMPMGLTIIPYSVTWGYNRDRAAAILNMGIPISFILFWVIWYLSRGLQ